MSLPRIVSQDIEKTLHSGKSVLLLGPRQTGKTTLIQNFPADLYLSLLIPDLRQKYEKDPSLLRDAVENVRRQKGAVSLVVIDEIQKIPSLMDSIQDLIDRKIARFILTGSSARKLYRAKDVNLLPGRVILHRLDPLLYQETQKADLQDLLMDGSLPEIHLEKDRHQRQKLLESYVVTYLEEEIRAEALVRDLGVFGRFLELAASEAGGIVNFSKLSQEIGISHVTIASYYQILEDCLIAERVDPLTSGSSRKKLTKSSRYLFFDLGVRRLAAGEGTEPPLDVMGRLFEQFVGLELIRNSRLSSRHIRIKFWRDPSGPEVDWVIDREKELIPVEVKWTEMPTEKDARHLKIFLAEHAGAQTGYIVCRTAIRRKIDECITAVPWQEISTLIEN